MSIQFPCAGCQQPIEVDGEWAGKTVACPYCRRTITAPTQSTLTDVTRVPMANPLAGSNPLAGALPPARVPLLQRSALRWSSGSDSDAGPLLESSGTSQQNPLAVTAFVLACVMFGFLVSVWLVTAAHPSETAELERQVREGGSSAVLSYWQKQGGQFPGWMIAVGFLEMGGILCGAAAVICAILALRRPARRFMAILALVGCGGVMMFFVLAIFAAFAVIVPRA